MMITSLAAALLLVLPAAEPKDRDGRGDYFAIRVVDEQTGRGVPLIELRTTNEIRFYTDSAGMAAFREPGLMDREVFFHVGGPGYEVPPDGFGSRGARLKTTPGAAATVKVRRTNVAERLYRITGQGIYRDSALLGLPSPAGVPPLNLGVMGQDSVQAVPYRGRLFWLWGDTAVPHYPLGNFHTTAATSPLPGPDTFRPAEGVPLRYFADPAHPQRVRAMAPPSEPGMMWLFGLLTLRDPQGAEALVAHYARMKSLGERLEHGLMRFDDAAGIFRRIAAFDPEDTWRHPRGNAVRVREEQGEYFYFTERYASTRVKADWQSLLDPQQYEALAYDEEARQYRWQRSAPPTAPAEEERLIGERRLDPAAARYQLRDAATGDAVRIHRCSIQWNAYRKCWVLIGNQEGGKISYLGEVWYAEAPHPSGPWRKAVRIASHPDYSFYNPRQHVFFDEEGGRRIYFEGTYTAMFSGNRCPTPRYEYNQLMYRLDLADERLAPARLATDP